MEDLKSIVDQRYEELNSQRKTNRFEDLSEDMIRAAVQKAIFDRAPLSRAADSREALEKLTDKLIWNMPTKHASFGRISNYVIGFDICFWKLLEVYGIPAEEKELKPDELYFYTDFGEIDHPKYELRVLPDHPKTVEVTGRLIYLDYKRRQVAEKYGDSYTPSFITPGFDNWRAAIVFANYSHIWFNSSPEFMARRRNAPRYRRFKFTSFEAVKAVKPGELFQVENVFGNFAAEYVQGDMERFKELSYFAHLKDGKKHVEEANRIVRELKGS